ncbi:hypothetical protein GUJ93_ZPchr0007g4958 [Zizania palustris]|uniref:Uncharacterized protein n=1 Tax=Zizania palustris TaxID=103762 RepID=A0A8J5VRU9_ZIZPA|nr:hypothetical protein GUJ93_ZPchr0007g4958 [Zizania palustris]
MGARRGAGAVALRNGSSRWLVLVLGVCVATDWCGRRDWCRLLVLGVLLKWLLLIGGIDPGVLGPQSGAKLWVLGKTK